MKNLIIILFTLFNIAIQAHDFNNLVTKIPVEKRIALVIGNGDYTTLPHLKNSLNDARLMRKTLKKSGFRIFYQENAKIRDMKKLLKKFAYKIAKGGIGLYYFAGHSANVDGKNYLVGIDALLDNQDYIAHEAISLNTIIKKMRNAGNRLNVLVSDTCRNTVAINKYHNNHFGRGVGKGLLALSNTERIFIAYSTASGELHRDGKNSSHGILTRYLVKNLKKEGATIKEIFTKTQTDVYEHTKGKQTTAAYNKIKKDFFFILSTDKPKQVKR